MPEGEGHTSLQHSPSHLTVGVNGAQRGCLACQTSHSSPQEGGERMPRTPKSHPCALATSLGSSSLAAQEVPPELPRPHHASTLQAGGPPLTGVNPTGPHLPRAHQCKSTRHLEDRGHSHAGWDLSLKWAMALTWGEELLAVVSGVDKQALWPSVLPRASGGVPPLVPIRQRGLTRATWGTHGSPSCQVTLSGTGPYSVLRPPANTPAFTWT